MYYLMLGLDANYNINKTDVSPQYYLQSEDIDRIEYAINITWWMVQGMFYSRYNHKGPYIIIITEFFP